ncbi:hypothetical protein ABIA35_007653, partial [Catenulispora sp. MAP12-49]
GAVIIKNALNAATSDDAARPHPNHQVRLQY